MCDAPSPARPRSARTGRTLTDAYFAGYLDADGCVRFSDGTPRIEVAGVFPWVLDEFADRYGGTVSRTSGEGERPFYRWRLSGWNAALALQSMGPHLIVKRVQAELVLRAYALPPGPERDGIAAQIKALKHHGYEA